MLKMLDRVQKTLKKYRMVTQGEKVVLGVSGGADSMAMMHALNELNDPGLELIVAHLNHGIRDEEARRDADFVREAARALKLKFVYGEVDTLAFKEEKGLSLEDAARTLRYKFLNDVLKKNYATKIATAHTLDDQAETVLMRLIRGSGSRGLSGIPPVSNNTLIRPLIETLRAQVEEYLKSGNLKWVEDSTNKSDEHLRNRIRNTLLADLEEFNPRIKNTLAKTADILRKEDEFISNEARKYFDDIFNRQQSDILGDLKLYIKLDTALRFSLLRTLIEEHSGSLKNVSSTHIIAADDFLLSETTSGDIELPGETVISKGYDLFLVTTKLDLDRKFSYNIIQVGKWGFPEFEVEVEYVMSDNIVQSDETVAHFDPDSVKLPIEVRNYNPGDRFFPLGMKTEKKLQDFFTDIKLPKFMRLRVPVFTFNGEIIWLGGLRIDDRFKVNDSKNEVLRMKLIRPKII